MWDLSDPAGKGYLNKGGFFVALKLVSLSQIGKEVNMVNITADVPPPKMVSSKIFKKFLNNVVIKWSSLVDLRTGAQK